MEIWQPFVFFLRELMIRFETDFLDDISKLHAQIVKIGDAIKAGGTMSARKQQRFSQSYQELLK